MKNSFQALEKRIAALELQLKNDEEKIEFAVDCWVTVLLQFIDDFNVTSPEIDKMVERLRQKEIRL